MIVTKYHNHMKFTIQKLSR